MTATWQVATVLHVDGKRTNNVSIVLSDAELKALDDWAWERRIRSRSEAIRQLLQLGLDGSKVRDAKTDAPEPDAE